jgi:DNA invertase Pin-like site-specific DNA recombinase
MSEFEIGLLQERVRSALAAVVRRGGKLGRPRVNVDVNRALELRAKGLSIRAAAREMKIGAATLQRALSAIGVEAAP